MPRTNRNASVLRQLVLTCTLVLVATACGLELPEQPYFETLLTLPFGSERFTGSDLADESEYVLVDSTAGAPLRLFFEGVVDTFRLGEKMDFVLPETAHTERLDQIEIPTPDPVDERFRIGELTDLDLPDGGISLVVPAFVIPPIRRELPARDDLSWVRFSSGRIDVRIHNLLPIPLGDDDTPSPSLRVRLFDRARGEMLVETALSSVVRTGAFGTATIDLTGVALPSALELEISGESPGSSGRTVFITPSSGFDLTAHFVSLEPDSAIAVVPAQQLKIEDSVAVALNDSLGIVGGVILDGTISIAFDNRLPLGANGSLRFPELLENGEPIALDVSVPPASGGIPGSSSEVIDLANVQVRSPDGDPLANLAFEFDVATDPSDGFVSLGRHQSISAGFDRATIRFASVDARPTDARIEIPRTETSLDLPEELEDIDLAAASLRLVIANAIPFPASGTVTVRTVGLPDPIELPFEIAIAPGTPASPTESSARIDESNSELLGLIRARPEAISIDGEVRIGDGVVTGTVGRDDYVRGRYEVSAPLRVRLGLLERTADDFDFTVSRDLQDRIGSDVVGVVARGRIVNHFPFAAETEISFSSSAELLEAPEVTLASVHAEAGLVDGSGRVTEPRETSFEITLPENDITFFARDRIFGRMVFRLRGDSSTVVTLSPDDYAEANGALEFRIGVGERRP
ncbi:MAG: hypothetical protein R3E97_03580 [Candidatus Eisenbacteria bacterium]